MTILRGLEAKHEQNPELLLRDTRTLGKRFVDFFKNPGAVAALLIVCALGGFVISGFADILLIVGVLSFFAAYFHKATLPFRLPMHANRLDHNDPKPGSVKPRQSGGIYYFGNEKKTNQELWFTNEDMRTHVLIFGSTGSGKTETMISLAYNALIQGSGFIYVDGKGDNGLYAKIFSMARSMGREDDLLLINFMTGARDIIGPQVKRLSNTLNPFANGSSSMLSQLIVGLMDSSAASSDADMWKGRAIAFVEALMKILVACRDRGDILLDANMIRNYFELQKIESIVLDNQLPRDGKEPASLEGLPPEVVEPIRNYLINLPGYKADKRGKHVSQVYEQHGFITMQLVRVFSSLADAYGHILRTRLAEVDLRDVVLNRRILLVLLPALEKSPDELSNLGKIIIASLKVMMASGLGDEVEGEYQDLIKRKPTNAKTPYLCILDEYGYYAVEGFAVVPAQARSLGFSVVFAGQDLPAFQKSSKEEAASIGANTNIKIAMKLEDPIETWDFFSKTAGESYVTHVGGFQTDSRSVMNHYMDTRSAGVEKRARVDLLDLKDQRQGEMHIFFQSKIVRADSFFANPEPPKVMRLNHFLKIDAPDARDIAKFSERVKNFEKTANKKEYFKNVDIADNSLEPIFKTLNEKKDIPPVEGAITALLSFHGQEEPKVESKMQQLSKEELNIFTELRSSEQMRSSIIAKSFEQFAAPILNYAMTSKKIRDACYSTKRPDDDANKVADEIIKDMEVATYYPPKVKHSVTGVTLAATVAQLISEINLKKKEKAV